MGRYDFFMMAFLPKMETTTVFLLLIIIEIENEKIQRFLQILRFRSPPHLSLIQTQEIERGSGEKNALDVVVVSC